MTYLQSAIITGGIEVSGSTYTGCTGTYYLTHEKSTSAPEKPVYKLSGSEHRYMYYCYSPKWRASHWRIGFNPANTINSCGSNAYFYKGDTRASFINVHGVQMAPKIEVALAVLPIANCFQCPLVLCAKTAY